MTEPDVRAMMLVEPHRLAATMLRQKPMENGAWLAVEAVGLSGADVQAWKGERRDIVYPLIPGQQVVGRIVERLDTSMPHDVGTRVVVEPVIRCGVCHRCSAGLASCTYRRPMNAYGNLPSTENPGLWGGLAELMYIDPFSRVHPLGEDIAPEAATFAHPLAAGYMWAVEIPQLQPGSSVLILGPGPRGLACLVAAQAAGAEWVGISGLDVDADRLAFADDLGAQMTVDVSVGDVSDAVGDSLGKRPDVVIDVTSNDPEAIYSALDLVRPGGKVVLASTKGSRALTQFFSDIIVAKQLTILGALGASSSAFEWATARLAQDERLDAMVSHQFPLNEADRALQATAGMLGHDELISVAVTF